MQRNTQPSMGAKCWLLLTIAFYARAGDSPVPSPSPLPSPDALAPSTCLDSNADNYDSAATEQDAGEHGQTPCLYPACNVTPAVGCITSDAFFDEAAMQSVIAEMEDEEGFVGLTAESVCTTNHGVWCFAAPSLPPASPPSQPPSIPQDSNASLSSSEIVGIVVGSCVLIFILVGFVWALYKRKLPNTSAKPTTGDGSNQRFALLP